MNATKEQRDPQNVYGSDHSSAHSAVTQAVLRSISEKRPVTIVPEHKIDADGRTIEYWLRARCHTIEDCGLWIEYIGRADVAEKWGPVVQLTWRIRLTAIDAKGGAA